MSQVLDQSEIDALLASVDEGAPAASMSAGPPEAERPRDAGVYGAGVAAHTYDFKRPERVSKDQIRSLSSIHEVFARNFGATLSGLLRTIVDVRVVGVEQLTYSEFIHSLPNPTCFLILNAPPLEGQICLEISPLIIYPIMDRLLGGANQKLFIPSRPLTSIEWRLVRRIVDRALRHLSEVWRNLVEARFEVAEAETNPQLVHIVAPTEVVVFVTFEIKFGVHAGTMSLCVPFNVIESVLSHLNTQSWFYKPKPPTQQQQKRIGRSLSKSQIEVRAFLGQTTLRLSDLRAMRVGDVIELDKRCDRELILQVEGRTKYAGRPGQVRGKMALRLTRSASVDERL